MSAIRAPVIKPALSILNARPEVPIGAGTVPVVVRTSGVPVFIKSLEATVITDVVVLTAAGRKVNGIVFCPLPSTVEERRSGTLK
jgi:hypothetical protein